MALEERTRAKGWKLLEENFGSTRDLPLFFKRTGHLKGGWGHRSQILFTEKVKK